METNITRTTELKRELEITVDATELGPHFEKAYARYRPKVQIKGFRKGKAPLELIKRIYGESIERDSLDTVADDLYRQVAEEKNLKVVGEPTLIQLDYKRGESLRFKIKYEVPPEIELKQYKGLKVEKLLHRVSDKEVDREIERLRQINRTMTEVEKALDDEHILTVDIQEVDGAGFPIVGKKNENVRLYLKEESLFPQLREALRGAERGKEYRAKVESVKGKERLETDLLVKVKKVERVNLPDFDGAFVSKMTKGKVTSVELFKENLKRDLEKFWKDEGTRSLKDALVGEIIKRYDFSVPEGLVKFFLDSFIEDIRQQQPNKKLPSDFNEEEFRKKNQAYAIWQAKWLLLKEKIIEVEQITVTDSDLEKLAEEESKKIGIEKGRLVKYYKTSTPAKTKVLSEKLMNFLIEHAVIEEKIVDEDGRP